MTKSLVSKKEETAVIPIGDFGGPVEIAPSLHTSTPFVAFLSTKSPLFAKAAQQIPDLEDGSPVLVENDTYAELAPFKFYIPTGFQHFSHMDASGNITESTLDREKADADKDYWKEYFETFILVILPDRIVPATCRFGTVKAGAARAALEALNAARDDASWGKLSSEHKATLATKTAYARFKNVVSLKRGTSAAGFNYVVARTRQFPTGLADWDALSEAFKSPDFKRLAEATYNRYLDRVEDIKGGIKSE